MTFLDDDLVRAWFDRASDIGEPVMPQWGIVPTKQEQQALSVGGAAVAAAVAGRSPRQWEDQSALTEQPALMLQRYLTAFAAGVASARLAFATADLDADPGTGVGDTGALALAAGLNAGAAALHGEITGSGDRPVESRTYSEPTAADAARLAGFAAAELVVNGAGLQQIAAAAAAAVCSGWRIGLPAHPVDRLEYRTRGLVGLLLVALEIQTRDPEPPAEPASCGALPGENPGRPFVAEITFTMGLPPAEIRSLADELDGLASEVQVWPGGQWPRFHVHSDRPGEVIGQVYAYGTPFDLVITECV